MATLPHWNLSPLFSGFDTPEFATAWSTLQSQIARIENLFEQHHIADREMRPSDQAAFAELTAAYNDLIETRTRIVAYIYAIVTTDSTNAAAQAKLSEIQMLFLRIQRLQPRQTAWMSRLDPQAVQAGEYALMLQEARYSAEHLMSEAEEILAAELSLSGGTAFAQLHGNVSSLISTKVNGEEMPITAVRNLATSPDAAVRQAAYEAELAAWAAHEVPLAAAMNGFKGEASTLNRKRRYDNDLEPALQQNRITHKALQAMHQACEASFPAFRRYWAAKAKALGKTQLDWWDLFAPVGQSQMEWSWEESRRFIVDNLAAFSSDDALIAERAYQEGWVDAEPRKGKVGGAYCMERGDGLSFILTNYKPSFDAVSTMAHELGHAYHNWCLRSKPASLRDGPMTLAETASIMNETIVVQAALNTLPPQEQLPILEADLQGVAQVVVDIHSRFLFEQAVFAGRKERELSPGEFCELMLNAQRQTYGEALATYHPYMWAVKPHYYGSNFYNFPYTFGLLFGLALYQRYQQEGAASFLPKYEELLASVGVYDAKTLAARFGFDIEDTAFWAGGLKVIEQRIARFESLIEK